jgi:protein-S-isoprenylcysteine O-methyltransferase Ste14
VRLSYVGMLALSLSLAAGAIAISAIAFLNALARHEGNRLLQSFSDDHRNYMDEVPRWIPRLRRG